MADDVGEREDYKVMVGNDFKSLYGNRDKIDVVSDEARNLFAEPGEVILPPAVDVYLFVSDALTLVSDTNKLITEADLTAGSGFADPMTTRGDIIYKDATSTTRLGIGTTGQVLGTSDGIDLSWIDSSSGTLKELDQGNGIGWTVQCRIDLPDRYGNIGKGAVDFTSSVYTSSTIGATGTHSFACGKWTTASGSESFSNGYNTTASGNYSHAEGYYTTASGIGSHAEGYYPAASGDYSHAEGYNTAASGDYSHAEGYNTAASGIGSHAEGYYTTAQNQYQHSAGKYNIGTSLDTVHETGIGTDNLNRANAFEIYTDGRIHAPAQTIALHDNPRSLVTKEYADALGGTFSTAVTHTWTAPQLAEIVTGSNALDFNTAANFTFTATAANITVTSQSAGQSGTIKILLAENITGWGTEFTWGNQGVPTDLSGTEYFSYTIFLASGVDSIIIGRV